MMKQCKGTDGDRKRCELDKVVTNCQLAQLLILLMLLTCAYSLTQAA